MALSLTTRLGLRRWSADADQQTRADFDGAHAQLEDLAAGALSSTAALRPAAAAANARFIHHATDTGNFSWSTGAAWVPLENATSVVGASVTHSGNQSIPNVTNAVVAFNTERFDDAGFHDNVTNNSRLTIPAGLGGLYVLHGSLSYALNTTGRRHIQFRLNGSIALAITSFTALGGGGTEVSGSWIGRLVAGDYVDILAYQDSGGALDVAKFDRYTPEFQIARLGV